MDVVFQAQEALMLNCIKTTASRCLDLVPSDFKLLDSVKKDFMQ